MTKENYSKDRIQEITLKLLDYCKRNDWAGYDPYDALNSKLLSCLPFLDFRLFRLGLTQILKRSPINFRPLLLVPKTQNPKAIALFLMAFLKLEKLGLLEDRNLIPLMVDRLIALRSPLNPSNSSNSTDSTNSSNSTNPSNSNNPYWCWGYSFPWQTRTVIVPRHAPNLVCTSFVANALLDAYEENREAKLLEMARSAAEYILNELYWTDGGTAACFSYPLCSSRTKIHNANFLGAALLCRVYRDTGDSRFLEPALSVARYSASRQHSDGAWDYGEDPTQRWVDNFHTGYNLSALRAIGLYGGTSEFESNVQRGFEFYRSRFFGEEGAPKYFHDHTYPIDIHSVAQSIITLLTLKDSGGDSISLAHTVFGWSAKNMMNGQGYFYYQASRLFVSKISYMRWSQAWMLLALASLLTESAQSVTETRN